MVVIDLMTMTKLKNIQNSHLARKSLYLGANFNVLIVMSKKSIYSVASSLI